MGVDRTKPYNTLPKLPPAVDLDTKTVLRALNLASRALAELNGLSEAIPNPHLIIDAVVLQETQASSSIENLVTTQDELYKANVLPPYAVSPQAKETLRYREALYSGFEALRYRRLNVNVFQHIQGKLEGIEGRIRQVPGTTLKAGNEVIYTPPVGEALLQDLLENLVKYLYDEEGLDPLIRMAVAHYQFEAIHPFTDGNGRTGRIVNVLYLVEKGLLRRPILYLSGYLLHNRRIYYKLLEAVTQEGAFESWVLFLLEGIRQAAEASVFKITGLLEAMRQFSTDMQIMVPTLYSQDLVQLLFRYPYCKISFASMELGVSYLTARKYLQILEKAGLLTSEKHGKTLYFRCPMLLNTLSSSYEFRDYSKSTGNAGP